MSIGVHTFNQHTKTNQLNFNPFSQKSEKIFESLELTLNTFGWTPIISNYSGAFRISYGLILAITGIANSVINSIQFVQEKPSSMKQRIICAIKIWTKNGSQLEEISSSPAYCKMQRHLNWFFHGVANIARGFIEISGPIGIGNAALFLYDRVGKYRYEYDLPQN
jgi:hypothetical protein